MQISFESILAEQFDFVKALRQKDDKEVIVLRHKTLGTEIVKITGVTNHAVYEILSKIKCPNLPKIFGVYLSENGYTVIEEYIKGVTIADVLSCGRYNEEGTRKVSKSVCQALHCLHGYGIIHRDIKPENVIISDRGVVKLIDFDASRIRKDYQSKDTSFVGTVGFAAPEQFGISQTDGRADIFSLGVMMNVMLTGEHPSKLLYKGKLKKIIEKCIAVDPNKRFFSVEDLYNKI